jgi:protein O-mannosyl-transferase
MSKPSVSQTKKNPAGTGNSHRLTGIIIFLAAFFVYSNSISNEYALDDEIVIRKNEFTRKGFSGIGDHLTNESFTGFFGKRQELVEGGRYRPLSYITFAIEEGMFNKQEAFDNPGRAYDEVSSPGLAQIRHGINVVLFALCCWLLYVVLVALLGKGKGAPWLQASFIGALFFALHPIHTEVVANIKGRDEIMALLFSLLTLWYALKFTAFNADEKKSSKGFLALSVIFLSFFLGLLSKENTVTFLAIIPLALWWFRKPTSEDYAFITLALIVGFGCYYGLRANALALPDDYVKPTVSTPELLNDPWAGVSAADRFGTVSNTFGKYLELLVAPVNLTHDYYPWQIPLTSPTALPALIPMLLGIAILFYGVWGIRRKDPVAFFILYFFLTFSIVSNLLISIGTLMGERFLFFSSIGFCMAAALLIVRLGEKLGLANGRLAVLALVVLPSLGFTIKTVLRNPVWKNDYTLFTTDVLTSVNSTKSQTSAGGQYYEKAIAAETSPAEKAILLDSSLIHLDKALVIYPLNHHALLLKGNVMYAKGNQPDSAIASYRKVLKKIPGQADALKNIAVVANNSGRNSTASWAYKEYLKVMPNDAIVWHDMGVHFRNMNNIDSAIYAMNGAITVKPDYGGAWSELGNYYGQFKADYPKALAAFANAIKYGFNAEGVYENYGIAYAVSGNYPEAIRIWTNGLAVHPSSAKLYTNIYKTYMNMGDAANAQVWANKANAKGIKVQ